MDDFAEAWDDPEHYEGDCSLDFGISMEKAKSILPILQKTPIHITDGRWSNKLRKDIPKELIESLNMSLSYDIWLRDYEKLNSSKLPIFGGCIKDGLERVTTYHNIADDGEEERWYLEINEKGRSLLEWFNSKE